MAEVQLGKLASERAANAEVKAFGQMMVKDHTAAGNELKQIASGLNAQLPTQLDQKHRDLVDRLSKLQGAAFDDAYMDAMVQGHQEVVAKLTARSGDRATSGSTGGDRAASGSTGSDRAGTTATGSSGGASSTTAGTGSSSTQASAKGDQALTQWAQKTLPTVQQHLQRARELQQKVNK